MKRYHLATLAMLYLSGCGTNSLMDRSLIFATHTSLGIDISVNPSEMDSPAKLQIGYKRTEGVLDPVFYNLNQDNKNPTSSSRTVSDFYLPEAYSVLAKFQGSASGSGGGSSSTSVTTGKTDASGNAVPGSSGSLNASVNGAMTLSQWFATGEAAKILARYGGGALSDNPAVSAAVSAGAGQQAFSQRLQALPAGARAQIFTSVYNTLNAIGTEDAKKQAAALDKAAVKVLTADRINLPAVYSYNPTPDATTHKPTLTIDKPAAITSSANSLFISAVTRLQEMETSVQGLEAAKAAAAGQSSPPFEVNAIHDVNPGDFVGPSKTDAGTFEKTIQTYQQMDASLRSDLTSLQEFQAAVQFIAQQLGLKE